MFRHVGIVVNDLDKQLFFYRDLLGLDVIYNQIECDHFIEKILSISGVSIDIYKLGKHGKVIVELLHYLDSKSRPMLNKEVDNNGITHFAITVDDVNILYKNLIDNGVAFLSHPEINLPKTHIVCFCRDFENNLIELVQQI